MNLRYREIHRESIKRRMYEQVDRRWEGLYSAFGASVLCVFWGIQFCLMSQPGSGAIGAVLLGAGILLFALYRFLFQLLRRQGNTREWLKPKDQWIVAAIMVLALALARSDSLIWLAAFMMSFVYGQWKLWKYSRPYWRSFLFRVGRPYLREVERHKSLRRSP